jgi:hypothetical protein
MAAFADLVCQSAPNVLSLIYFSPEGKVGQKVGD